MYIIFCPKIYLEWFITKIVFNNGKKTMSVNALFLISFGNDWVQMYYQVYGNKCFIVHIYFSY